MNHKRFFLIVLILLALISGALAQDMEAPVVAILRFGGPEAKFTMTESTVLDMLQAYGYVSGAEREALEGRHDLQGEKIEILWGEAGWDLPTVNLMVEEALDAAPDALVTLTTAVTQIAVNATLDMDYPPAIFFASVHDPYVAGIAETPCVKPAHIAGSQLEPSYEDLIKLLSIYDPEIQTIGTVFNSSEVHGAVGAQKIAEIGEARGYTVFQSAVNGIAELPLAIEGLVSKGIEALLLPVDSLTVQGSHLISHISIDHGIPLFYPSVGTVYGGATFGLGFYAHYDHGLNIGRLLTAYLNGDLDLAATAIDVQSGRMLAINFDVAAAQDVEISEHLRSSADIRIEDGHAAMSTRARAMIAERSIEELQAGMAADVEYLESLRCAAE